ncbi:MAG TPA: hypothetical protein EYM25_02215 [Deltaproteobacteria bacterium]|nr:hypothetical protein [Deltaproteobacteria bacterium]
MSNAHILNEAIRVIGYEVSKQGRLPYNNSLIDQHLQSVAENLSVDHVNELIEMYRLDTPNVDGAVWNKR